MLDDLRRLQPILQKRGCEMTEEERAAITETLFASRNLAGLHLMCLRNLGYGRPWADAEDAFGDWCVRRLDHVITGHEPYPATLWIGPLDSQDAILFTAKKLGKKQTNIAVAFDRGEPGVPLGITVEGRTIDAGLTVRIVLQTESSGAVCTTAREIVEAVGASARASELVSARVTTPPPNLRVSTDATHLEFGGPWQPAATGREWRLFRAVLLLDLKRLCWRRGADPFEPLDSDLAHDPQDRGPAEPGDEAGAVEEPRSPQDTLIECLEQLTDRDRRDCFGQISPLDRELIELHHLRQPRCSYDELFERREEILRGVAERHPKVTLTFPASHTAMKVRLFKARKKLAKCLVMRGMFTSWA
jgi:hypothetical protein